jgi:SAM-dependent methyltransferase
MTRSPGDGWLTGDAYESYMGRWSRPLARKFVEWLEAKPLANWLEVGCGTGALTSAISDLCRPASIVACDPSGPFIEYARKTFPDARASFVIAGAEALPSRDGGFDAIVSGLVLNFLPDVERAVSSMRERLRQGGAVAAYVWDYADGLEFLRLFWDEAVTLDPGAAALDEGRRFPLCRPEALGVLFRAAGLAQVETHSLEIPTNFATFDDYWTPFLQGTGPAPNYVASLAPPNRESLERALRQRLQVGSDGRIRLRARAWAARALAN